ncbi:MAG: hypothetical protein ABSH01_04420 [Terriglobia bacterium]|jgi:hypothetical protein
MGRLKGDDLLVAVRLRRILLVLRPVAFLDVELEPEPLVEERHDRHHLLADVFRFIVSHEFVAESEHVVPAKLVHEFLRNNSQERREETALLSDCLVWTLRKFQVGEVCVYFVFNDFPPQLNKVWSGSGGVTAQPLMLYLIKLDLAFVLSLQRVRANRYPRVIEVEEVRTFGVLLLRGPAVRAFHEHDIRLDFTVRVIRSTCVPPALALKLHVLVDRKFSSHKKFLCLANTEI